MVSMENRENMCPLIGDVKTQPEGQRSVALREVRQ
jgi:hypothetical protein